MDDVALGMPAPQPRVPVVSNGVLGTLLFVVCETMLFAGFISAHTITRATAELGLRAPGLLVPHHHLLVGRTACLELRVRLAAGTRHQDSLLPGEETPDVGSLPLELLPPASVFRPVRFTKIVATIGPASEDRVGELIDAGLSVARLNFSHGTPEEHQRRAAKVRDSTPVSAKAMIPCP